VLLSNCTLQSPVKQDEPVIVSEKVLDPTGTYTLDEGKLAEDGEYYGYSGTILVKQLSADRIEMGFSIVRGAPGYNSGSFYDTLTFENNRAVYRYESCKITFIFKDQAIDVIDDPEVTDCGFGGGVFAHGTYQKTSSETPIVHNPMVGE